MSEASLKENVRISCPKCGSNWECECEVMERVECPHCKEALMIIEFEDELIAVFDKFRRQVEAILAGGGPEDVGKDYEVE